MGLFGGKKDEQSGADGDGQQDAPRRSRRIVQPGSARKQAGTKKGAKKSAARRKSGSRHKQDDGLQVDILPGGKQQPARAETPAPQAAPQAPPQAAPDLEVAPAPAKPSTDQLMQQRDVPPEQRPGSKPVQAAPEIAFSGSLAEGTGAAETEGVCRTGEPALIEFLIERANLVTSAQVEEAKHRADDEGLPIDVALARCGHLDENDMVDMLTQECYIPHLRIDKYSIRKKSLATLDESDARRYSVLPVDKLGSILSLAMVNPLDEQTVQAIEQKTGLDVKPVVASRSEIEDAIAKNYGGKSRAATSEEESRTFSQDAESVDIDEMKQAVQKVEAPATAPVEEAPAEAQGIEVSEVDEGLVADIDDLLGGDEVMPETVEPVAIDEATAPAPVEEAPTPVEEAPTPAEEEPAAVPMGDAVDQEEAEPAPATAEDLVSTDDLFEEPMQLQETPAAQPAAEEAPPVATEAAGDEAAKPPTGEFDLGVEAPAEPAVEQSDVIDASDLFEGVEDESEAKPTSATHESIREDASALEVASGEAPSEALEPVAPAVDLDVSGEPPPVAELEPVEEPAPAEIPAAEAAEELSPPVEAAPPPEAIEEAAAPAETEAPTETEVPAEAQAETEAPAPADEAAPEPVAAAAAPSTAGVKKPRSQTGTVQKPLTSRPATRSFQAKDLLGKNEGVVTLVEVGEDQFQHAVTHGRRAAFEKWVSIQSRNRMLNAVPVEDELGAVLEPVFSESYQVDL